LAKKSNEQREEAENEIVKAKVAADVALENVAKVCKHTSVCSCVFLPACQCACA